MKRRVVITGMGAISPIGNTVDEMWNSAKNGKNGVTPITKFDTENFKVKVAAEVKNFDPSPVLSPSEAKKYDLFVQYAVVAAAEAFAHSKLDMTQTDPTRCGTLISSGIGGIGTISQAQVRGESKGYDRVSPYFIPTSITNMAAGGVAINHGRKGKCSCVVTACAGGTFAIG
ncbi:MAG: beta-ketoacyl synthase N-terminal-like domain-containing protein, partial [Eubacteriales bacterium]